MHDFKPVAKTFDIIGPAVAWTPNFEASNSPIFVAIELKFGKHVSWAKGSRCTKFHDDRLKFSYNFPLNSKLRA